MNKEKFLRELRLKLRKLPKEELENVMNYYEEYFEEANIDDEVDVTKELGTPTEIASQILADSAIESSKPKNRMYALWLVILAIFAAPIGIPLLFAVIMIIAALVFAAVVTLLAFVAAGAAVVFSGIAMFIGAFTIVATEFTSSLVIGGVGIALVGAGILFVIVMIYLFRLFISLVIKLSNKLVNKSLKKKKEA